MSTRRARLLIRDAQVVDPDGVRRANVLVEGDRIIDPDAPATAACHEVLDASGLLLMPGVIDDQVHFREPGLEYKEDLSSGSRACARGGVTTFLDMPNTRPATTTRSLLHDKLERAGRCALVNYGFFIGATTTNLEELRAADRTPGIKIFIGSSTGDLLVDEQEALERIFAGVTLPITAHCEDEATVRANAARLAGTTDVRDHSRIRDHAAALIATKRGVGLALRHGRRFHVLHVSTGGEVDFLRTVPPGLITAEACVHHLWFTVEDYARLGSRVQMNPSIKTRADVRALWAGLHDGTIQVVATDHAPHTPEEKARPYPESPSGLPAVENSLALMLDAAHRGLCTLPEIVRWMCDAPARTWDVVDRGRIAVGCFADLVLVDPERTRVIRDETQITKCGWSPWAGQSVTGWPVCTLVNGRIVFREEAGGAPWFAAAPAGREVTFDHARGGWWAGT